MKQRTFLFILVLLSTVTTSAQTLINGIYYKLNADTKEAIVTLNEPVPADIAINETNFPDENFRNYLLGQSYGSDGVLTDAEIAGITSIEVRRLNIKNLQGIEFFTSLTELECYGNQLTSLDVSKNTALTELECYGNQLTTLDVTGCTALKKLNCEYNQLTSLDVSECKALEDLNCYDNQLTTLSFSNNPLLMLLNCSNNLLTSLDVSNNKALESLQCYNNKLTSLDLSNTAMIYMECYGNQIKGVGMDAFVEGLPQIKSESAYDGLMYAVSNENEGNVMTTTHVAAAKAKGWKPYYYDGSDWEEYAGSEPVDLRGDLNGDGEVNMSDVMFLVQRILNGKFPDE